MTPHETDSPTLRPTTEADLADLLALWNDGQVMQWVGFPSGLGYDPERVRGWFQRLKSDPARHHFVAHAKGVGFCGELYYAMDLRHRRAGIDIKFIPAAQGKGLATTALRALIDLVFKSEPLVNAVWTEPALNNVAAQRLYERCGLKPMPRPADMTAGPSYWELRREQVAEALTSEVTVTVQRLYGSVPRIVRLISNNNFVYRLDFESGLSSKVIKLAGSGEHAPESIRREQQALRALASHGIDVPPIEFTQDDLPQGPKPFTIMPLLPGTTLGDAFRNQTPPWVGDGCRWAGRFVHRIGAVPTEAFRAMHRPVSDQIFLAYVRKNFDAENMLVPPFSTLLEEAERLLQSPVQQLIHGDYSLGQIITDGHKFVVIDWESVTVGHPLNMLGRAVAMMREYGGTQQHIDMLIEGYEQGHALTDADRRDLHLWEMWHHVGCMGWKFVCGSDHRSHAFAMAERVKGWAKV